MFIGPGPDYSLATNKELHFCEKINSVRLEDLVQLNKFNKKLSKSKMAKNSQIFYFWITKPFTKFNITGKTGIEQILKRCKLKRKWSQCFSASIKFAQFDRKLKVGDLNLNWAILL